MKISGVDIRPGNIIEYEGGIWRAVKIQHTQPGKGGAYMQVELKNLRDNRKNNVRFRSAETVERVRLDTKDFQFLFADGDGLVFMDKETYDQVTLPRDLLGDAAAFLQDGMDVVMELYEEEAISVQLPDTIEATIVEADAVVKGQTASSSYKPAVLDNGVRVMVPPHIASGTRIVVDAAQRAGLPFETIPLTLSFRSAHGVLRAVDATFAIPEHFKGLSFEAVRPGTDHATARALRTTARWRTRSTAKCASTGLTPVATILSRPTVPAIWTQACCRSP